MFTHTRVLQLMIEDMWAIPIRETPSVEDLARWIPELPRDVQETLRRYFSDSGSYYVMKTDGTVIGETARWHLRYALFYLYARHYNEIYPDHPEELIWSPPAPANPKDATELCYPLRLVERVICNFNDGTDASWRPGAYAHITSCPHCTTHWCTLQWHRTKVALRIALRRYLAG